MRESTGLAAATGLMAVLPATPAATASGSSPGAGIHDGEGDLTVGSLDSTVNRAVCIDTALCTITRSTRRSTP